MHPSRFRAATLSGRVTTRAGANDRTGIECAPRITEAIASRVEHLRQILPQPHHDARDLLRLGGPAAFSSRGLSGVP